LNQRESVRDQNDSLTTYIYDAAGNLIRTNLPNNTVETREYDGQNRLAYLESRNSFTDAVIESFQYELDNVGNRTAVVENDGRRVEYTYDGIYRLTSESIFDSGAAPASRTTDYTYDRVGNRLTRDDSAEGLTSYTYDGNDRLTEAVLDGLATAYSYDENGNLLSRTSAIDSAFYEWDAENRLIAADTDGDGTDDVTYEYDAAGMRTAQTVNGEETRFLLDRQRPVAQVLEEYTQGGVIRVSYVYGNDLISQHRQDVPSYYHVDGLGSTRALSDAAGAVLNRYDYDAFGRVIGQIGSTGNVYLFAGEQRDLNLGMDYLRARYLDFGTGRFVSRDAFPGQPNAPFTLHRYLYANASPVVNTDPTGNFTLLGLNFASIVRTSLANSARAHHLWTFKHFVDFKKGVELAFTVYNLLITIVPFAGGFLDQLAGKNSLPGANVTASVSLASVSYKIDNEMTLNLSSSLAISSQRRTGIFMVEPQLGTAIDGGSLDAFKTSIAFTFHGTDLISTSFGFGAVFPFYKRPAGTIGLLEGGDLFKVEAVAGGGVSLNFENSSTQGQAGYEINFKFVRGVFSFGIGANLHPTVGVFLKLGGNKVTISE
jgi:RHS repeat-associated protein